MYACDADISRAGSVSPSKVLKFNRPISLTRKHLEFMIAPNESIKLEIQESISEFKVSKGFITSIQTSYTSNVQYSEWAPEPLILDFELLLMSFPKWILEYTTGNIGCVQRVVITMKVRCSQAQFRAFVGEVSSALADEQYKSLEKFFFP